MQQQSHTLVLTSTSYHKNADVERPLLNSEIDRSGSDADGRSTARSGSSAPKSRYHIAVLSPAALKFKLSGAPTSRL